MYNDIVGEATYMLRTILNDKNVSLYQLEKASNVSHATLNDIYNERSNINNCSIVVMSKIASSLNMNIDELYKKLSYSDLSLFSYDEQFDLFKSNTLQQLKRTGEDHYIDEIVRTNKIDEYYSSKNYLAALYLLSLVDYSYLKRKLPLLKKYSDLRSKKLDKVYVQKSIYLLFKAKLKTVTSVYKECIKEFLEHNIIEANIDDVA